MSRRKKKTSLYLRKSRKDFELEAMGEGETLARHKAALLDLAEKQGLEVVKIYEEMVSGESIADRPQMQLLLEDVSAGKYDGVLVMEIERLARGNTKDQGEVAEAFAMSKTLIITPAKTFDPNNEFDEEYFEFGLFMSRREYKTIRRRMQRGLMASIDEGNYVGSLPPYGYDVVRINKKERTLKPNDESKNVVLMFEWFVNEGLSAGEIAKRLTAMGVPTKTGRTEWNRATIKDILKNNLYTGMIRWNRRKTTKETEDGHIIKKKRRLTSSEYKIVKGKHPAIISQELFDAAQALFIGKVPVKANTTIINPFARLMVCKHCGKAINHKLMYGRTAQPRMMHTDSMSCKVKSSPYEDVINAVTLALKAHVEDFEIKLTNDEERRQALHHANTIKAMENELRKLESKRDQLFDFLESGIYTPQEFSERKNVINDKIAASEAALAEYRERTPEVIDYQEKIIRFSECIDALNDPDIPARHKNDLLKAIISKIEYDCIDHGRNKGGTVMLEIFLK